MPSRCVRLYASDVRRAGAERRGSGRVVRGYRKIGVVRRADGFGVSDARGHGDMHHMKVERRVTARNRHLTGD